MPDGWLEASLRREERKCRLEQRTDEDVVTGDTHALPCLRTLLWGCVIKLVYIDHERDEKYRDTGRRRWNELVFTLTVTALRTPSLLAPVSISHLCFFTYEEPIMPSFNFCLGLTIFCF